MLAVSGDFDKDEMVKKLETLFADWPFTGEKPSAIPTNTELASPGVYLVDKEVNQGRVSILLPGIKRENPDYFAVQVMNDILGGGGFTSHIMSSVRSDEGLAYSAYSSFPGGIYYPLTFTAARKFDLMLLKLLLVRPAATGPTVASLALIARRSSGMRAGSSPTISATRFVDERRSRSRVTERASLTSTALRTSCKVIVVTV